MTKPINKEHAPITSPLGRLFDVVGAAAYLGMTEGQLRRCVAARRVRVFRAGRKVQIYQTWLDEFRQACTSEADGDARGRIPEEPSASIAPLSLRDVMPKTRQIRVR
jgi:hypothetical protein